ncbi:tail fiber assembly protein [Dickeya fangzhongdai]|uniref:tail fiber assembly protein n=1 Tax=Dickeya fangzhongdai TaxID=1778540 RepID=UPI0023E3B2FF|nr:tail fiber assembly protein [Dickeya fangzhongdai]WES88047.1 tail fiber assembly protein [Dickeya fangzhongdai]
MRFSVQTQGFYPEDIEYGDTLPTDAVTITDEQYAEFFSALNTTAGNFVVIYLDGEVLKISNVRPDVYHTWDSGSLAWVLTDAAQQQQKADHVAAAVLQKSRLLDDVTKKIAPLQDAVDLDMATDTETAQLTKWKKYRVLLNRVDTSTAPDITWPDKPYK